MAEATSGLVPEFINFLFSNKPKFDCYFIVGNKDIGEPERIGGVKLMLMAHSDIFRCELEDSKIAEKEDVKVKDTHPETFKTMLKYVYGHDTTAELSFDEADNLLYLAEKYMIKRLKDRVATRLTFLLTPDNICSLINNPVCYTHLELNCEITKILQYDTDKVLASTQFLGLSPEGFLKILEQEGLAVPEIELWRAAVKWAKKRAGTDNAAVLRKQLSSIEKHLRVCTLYCDDFCSEVVTTNILTAEEVVLVCKSIGTNAKENSLTTFCNEIEPRKKLLKTEEERMYYFFWTDNSTSQTEGESSTFCFEIITKKHMIKLTACGCLAKDRDREPEGWMYRIGCVVTIRKVANPHIQDGFSVADQDNSPMIIEYNELVKLGDTFFIPFSIGGKRVSLYSWSNYSITMSFTGRIIKFSIAHNNLKQDSGDLLVKPSDSYSPVVAFAYHVVKTII